MKAFAIPSMLNRLTLRQIDSLNIGVMLVSAACAFARPFETFLFVYAFLGPLHYVTEISWLHDRQYFTKRQYDFVLLLALAMVVTLKYFGLVPAPRGTDSFLIFLAFAAALIFVTVKKFSVRCVLLLAAAAAAVLVHGNPAFEPTFGVFLPTLIHVFVFTTLFILAGALRGRSTLGIFSLLVFAGCSLFLLSFRPDRSHNFATDYIRGAYAGFTNLNYLFISIFNLHKFDAGASFASQKFVLDFNGFLYKDRTALAAMSFIAFAYTYHYLNWFSKTSVIQWHDVSRVRLYAVVAVWTGSIALYGYDYRLGLKWLFFLSLTHVLLEFPLNHKTLINLACQVVEIFSARRFAAP
ncbi:MAG: hypothetical protein M3O09_17745 [Acidobacteriota bacterium]|nr:hypothetical protein [Acidobacteriota bacterium]